MSTVSLQAIECMQCGTRTEGDFSVDYPVEVNQANIRCARCGFDTVHILHGLVLDRDRPHCVVVQNRTYVENRSMARHERCPFCQRPHAPREYGVSNK